jgi:hypothetical protein
MYMSQKVGKHYLLDPKLIQEARLALGLRTETETIEHALEETIQRAKFARLVKESRGKFQFNSFDFGDADEQTNTRHR